MSYSSNSWCKVRDSSLIMYPLIKFQNSFINHTQDTLKGIFSHSANNPFLPNLGILLFLSQFKNINCRVSGSTQS